MKLLNTNHGIACLTDDGAVAVLETPHRELGQAIIDGELRSLFNCEVKATMRLEEVTVISPVAAPPRYFIIGLNYQSHADEAGLQTQGEPIFGIAEGTSVYGSDQDIVLPERYPSKVDYEGEIGVVIGKRCENVSAADAWDYVAGLTPVNDISARDLQGKLMQEGGNFAEAKAFPTFKPTGPVLVTVDELTLPISLSVRTHVNGELRQDGNTRDMIHDVAKIVASISSKEVLLPGDILCTGTPEGVGFATGKFLSTGDVVEVQIGDWPILRNRIA
jgi:2-keto-4-pentenoate hydratase/2-oxohepta-3-ene-1,7-dioic acid hydratase in catechol pathway